MRLAGHRELPGVVVTLAIAGLATLLLAASGALTAADQAFRDAGFRWRGERTLEAPLSIVAIDERSLARYGQMPWPRDLFAEAVDRLRQVGVTEIAFDVAFTEPGLRASGEDARFRTAIARHGGVVLPVYRPLQSAPSVAAPLAHPLPALAGVAAGLGLVQFTREPAGQIRVVEPVQEAGGARVPVLGVALAHLARAHRGEPAALPSGAGLPGRFALDFPGPPGTFPTHAFVDLMDGKVPREALTDRLVLVGATAAGLPDTGFLGPFPGPVSGVELHATVVENVLGHRLLQPLPAWALVAGWAVMPGIGAWLARARGLMPGVRLAGWLGTLVSIGALARFGLDLGLELPVTGPWVFLTIAAAGGLFRVERVWLRDRATLLATYARDLEHEARRERSRIDGELHDEAQQLVIAVGRLLRRLRRDVSDPRLEEAEDLNQRILDELIRVRQDLVPRRLASEGLMAAVRDWAVDLQAREGLEVLVHGEDWPAVLPAGREEALYWLLREAVNNVVKHAGARVLTIGLHGTERGLELTVRDDGQGFDPARVFPSQDGVSHTGLERMSLRARGLGGRLAIRSAPGQGCELEFRIPVAG
ncbi:MAG: CHASE2 domain-containing protein [bacterium]|nr:CHASE2 domain-containing protein [bacterium]